MADEVRSPGSPRPRLVLVPSEADEVDLDALEVIKAFCLDPLSVETGIRIDEFVARRSRKATLRRVKD